MFSNHNEVKLEINNRIKVGKLSPMWKLKKKNSKWLMVKENKYQIHLKISLSGKKMMA